MPKRAATPPPSDDEPDYLTLYKPYPLNAHWELAADRIQFARWIACCIGTQPFYAFFYKPRAGGMVILEIERRFPGIDNLLGEHRWNDFLKNPTPEERNKISQVFYCLHKSDREVQKDGWKRINVEDAWFDDWSQKNAVIVHPYPKTHWCSPPREDRTNKALCRPLPVDRFPPPQKSPPPVVGSATWVVAKPGSADWVNAKSKGLPTSSANTAGGSSAKATPAPLTIPQRKPSSASAGISNMNRSRAPNTPNAWVKPVVSPVSASTAPLSTPLGTSPGDSPRTPSAQSPMFPPGLPTKPTDAAAPVPEKLIWADCDPDEEDDSWWSKDLPPDLNSDYADGAPLVIGPNMEDDLWVPPPSEAESVIEPWENEAGEQEVQDVQEAEGSLWDEGQTRTQTAQELVCPAHGVICKKGICEVYSALLREEKKAQRQNERELAGETGTKKKKRGRKGRTTEGNWRHGDDQSVLSATIEDGVSGSGVASPVERVRAGSVAGTVKTDPSDW